MFQNSLFLPFISAVAGVLGTILTYWLVGKRRIGLTHRHRLIEKNIERIHAYAAQHYWRYIGSSATVGELLPKAQKAKAEEEKAKAKEKKAKTKEEKAEANEQKVKAEEQLKISFFRLAQWFHMQYKYWKDVGGLVTVGDLTAERLLVRLQGALRRFFDKEIGPVQRHTLMSTLESEPQVREFFNKFKEKLDQGDLRVIFDKYKQWLENPEIPSLAAELRYFSRLFDFEINMCYESWYGRKPGKPKIDLNLVRARLNELIDNQSITLLDAKKYLRRIGVPNTEIQKLWPLY